MVLTGDFSQLKPIGDKSLYVKPDGSKRKQTDIMEQHAYHQLYRKIDKVVYLTENMRSDKENPDLVEWEEML